MPAVAPGEGVWRDEACGGDTVQHAGVELAGAVEGARVAPQNPRSIAAAAAGTQVLVVSHATALIEALEASPLCQRLHLEKVFGETRLAGATLFNKAKWSWPAR